VCAAGLTLEMGGDHRDFSAKSAYPKFPAPNHGFLSCFCPVPVQVSSLYPLGCNSLSRLMNVRTPACFKKECDLKRVRLETYSWDFTIKWTG
jgi:hypothetical protein